MPKVLRAFWQKLATRAPFKVIPQPASLNPPETTAAATTESESPEPATVRSDKLVRLMRFSLFSLLTFVVLITILLFFALDDSPLRIVHRSLNRNDIQRAKQMLYVAPEDYNQIKTITLNKNDINIAASYLLDHFVENTVDIRLGDRQLMIQVAIFVPKTFWGQFLDISLKLLQRDEGIKVKSLKIGEISIPDPIVNYLVRAALNSPPLNKYWQVTTQNLKGFRLTAEQVEVSYLASAVEQAKQLAIQKHREYPNLHLYQQQINEIVNQHDPAWRLSLLDIMKPLFAKAYQRSDADTAIRENRAVIIAVASYIYKQELRRYLPLGLVYSKEYSVFAYKRVDIPQHFIASALLTAVDNSLLSEKLGEAKELGDAESGSGFSFIDLTADRSGNRFGKLAVSSPQQARQLQQTMMNIMDYKELIPEALDLPEHLTDQEFVRIFQKVGSPAYTTLVEEIDKRIAALPIYQIH